MQTIHKSFLFMRFMKKGGSKVAFHCETKGIHHPYVLGDSLRFFLSRPSSYLSIFSLTQCLNNLISNSFKFTKEGSIRIKCWEETYLRSSKNNSRYHFEVQDTGIGIGEKDKERLFRPFQQAESQPILSREHSGIFSLSSRFLFSV